MDETFRSNQEWLQEILQSFNDVAWSADSTTWDTLFLSQSAEIVYGRPLSEFFDNCHLWRSLIHPNDRNQVETLIPDLFSKGVLDLEYRIFRPSGEVRWLYHRLRLIRDANGEAKRIDGIATDITGRQQAEKELQTANSNLETHAIELAIANEELQLTLEALRESEERFRATFEQAAVGICQSNVEGRFLRLNQKFCDLVGYTHEEMLNRTFMDLTYPEDLKADLKSAQRMWEREIDTYTLEKRYVRKDGSIVWVNLTCSLVCEPSGKPKYAIAVVEDISARKRAEEALYRREQEFRALVENSPDIIARFDRELRHLYVNPAVEPVTGIPPQAFIGKTNQDLGMPSKSVTFWRESVQSVFVTAQERIVEFNFPTPSGMKCYQSRIVPEFNPDGSVGSVLGVSRDISDRKLAEKALQKSEERFRNLVETTSDWVWEVDENGVYTYVSPKVSELLGYTVQELQGKTSFEFMPYREARRIANFYSQIVTVQEPFSCLKTTRRHKDGHLVVMETSGVPVFDGDGKFCGYRGISRDITDRKQIEEALKESQQKYQTLFEILPIGISITNEVGNIIEVNPVSEQLLGISTTESSKRKYDSPEWQIVRSDGTSMPASEFASVRALTENRVVKNYELGVVKPQGEITWLCVTAAPIPLPGYGVAIAYTDISEQKQAEEAAAVANRVKSEFLANISHELRTPLNGILGYAQILKKDTNLTDQQKNSLSIIHQCGEHLLTLIDDILDLSKIEAQKMELYPMEFHLPNFLRSLGDLFKMRAEQKDISFTYEIISPLPQGVIADQKRLRQVLSNLLSNAVKFTDRGGVTFKVGYSSAISGQWLVQQKKQETTDNGQQTADKIRFQVEDTGIGIESSKLVEIFLPFHQVGDRAHAVEGTGLGLAISQKLVQMMGSEIQVRSTLGEGSVFWCDLDFPVVSGWNDSNPCGERRIVGFKGDKRKVLIVDDNQVNRSILQELLEPLGFEILEAVDGQDCLNKAMEFQPDLILIDLLMPGLGGLQAVRQLRHLPQLKDMVAIALSANVCEITKQESLAAGCQDFLPKPVQTKQLLELLMMHLGLEGIYEELLCVIQDKSNLDHLPIVSLPSSEIAALSELVNMGDIKGILDQADKLEKLDNQLVPFATQLRQLARGFQLKQLREIIQQFIANTQ